ncbi:MAG: archaellin/type IV pilin N-terminal domain-containing protein [Candidatus Pacearchaeota archaeon]
MNKRGIEPVVATVLLIVITIAAVALIIAFVVPFVQKQLGTADLCYKANGIQLDSAATCYNQTTQNVTLKIVWGGNEALNLTKVRVSVSNATKTNSLEISREELPQNPGEESTVTKTFDVTNPTTISIAPVLKPVRGNEITCEIRSMSIYKC